MDVLATELPVTFDSKAAAPGKIERNLSDLSPAQLALSEHNALQPMFKLP